MLDVDPTTSLADVLREQLGLTGTKIGCNRGQCGCCTVIMDRRAIYSCLTLAVEAEGKSITTVEGLAKGGRLDPIQVAFVKHDAFQCGFCTPGQLMSVKALLDTNSHPTVADVREAISGNLCRCGSIPHIIEETIGVIALLSLGLLEFRLFPFRVSAVRLRSEYPQVDQPRHYTRHQVVVFEPVPELLSHYAKLLHPGYGVLHDHPCLR